MIDDPTAGLGGQFSPAIPAPAGAIVVLLPILVFLGVSNNLFTIWLTFFYTLAIALLMVSRLPGVFWASASANACARDGAAAVLASLCALRCSSAIRGKC